MEYQVDTILNGWFGEPPENSEQEDLLLRHLYEPLRKLERRLRELERAQADASWAASPDRSGGQFTDGEITRAYQSR